MANALALPKEMSSDYSSGLMSLKSLNRWTVNICLRKDDTLSLGCFSVCSRPRWFGCQRKIWLCQSVNDREIPHQTTASTPGNQSETIRSLPIWSGQSWWFVNWRNYFAPDWACYTRMFNCWWRVIRSALRHKDRLWIPVTSTEKKPEHLWG